MSSISDAERERLEKMRPGAMSYFDKDNPALTIPRRDSSGHFIETIRPTPQIPPAVQIGPFSFKIIPSEREIRVRENHSGDQLNAQIEFDNCSIAIAPTMCPDHIAASLLHEVLHGIWWSAGRNEDGKKMTNEDVIKFLAPALLDVFRRNPALVAFLMETEAPYLLEMEEAP